MQQTHSLQCHVLVNGLSLEAVAINSPSATLEKLLAVGRPEAAGDAADWLAARQHGGALGALSLLGEGIDPGAYGWLRADPVHLQLQRNGFSLTDPAALRLQEDEAQQLLASLNAHFAANKLLLMAPHPQRWYLRLEHAPDITTQGPTPAISAGSEPWLPRGGAAHYWRHWLNEVQMLLHEHPVNQARESRGEIAVNSVWLYGEGTRANIECGAIRHVYADNVLARGLALAAGLPPHALPLDAAEWLAHTPAPGTHLIVLDQPELTQLEHGWCVPLLGALRHGRLDALTLHLNNGAAVVSRRIEPRDLWKFWRRRQPLATWLSSTPHE